MTSESEGSIEKYNDEVRIQKMERILALQAGDTPVEDACATVGISKSTFYRWLAEGLLDSYLEESTEARRRVVRDKATEATEAIMDFMIQVARGQAAVRSGNPISAAEFVFRHAGLDAQPEAARPNQVNILVGLPEMVRFDIKDGSPRLKDGLPVILEDKAEDS